MHSLMFAFRLQHTAPFKPLTAATWAFAVTGKQPFTFRDLSHEMRWDLLGIHRKDQHWPLIPWIRIDVIIVELWLHILLS